MKSVLLSLSIILLAGGCSGQPGGATPSAAAQAEANYVVIVSFESASGMSPCALIEGSDGKLYGATEAGGGKGEDVVFRLNKDGSGYTVLHTFTGFSVGGDGSGPQGLVEGSDGALYGTTRQGGSRGGVLDAAGISQLGNGTVFKLNKDGSAYTVLRRFTCSDGDGSDPWAGVVQGPDGALYGTTFEDGREHQGVYGAGHGTVFKLSKDGSGYKVLHHFGVTARDGDRPFAALLAGSDGALYGTTDGGGTAGGRNGTVFKLGPDGGGYKVLHSFPDTPDDGRMPRAPLVEGRDGALYGTTQSGGASDYGTVFKLNKDGSGYRVLHMLTGAELTGDGADPKGLIEGNDGALYGTAQHHGKNGSGTVFKLHKDGGNFTVLHSFSPTDNAGAEPNVLVKAKDGALYGTTRWGGTNGAGTVFMLTFSIPRPTPPPTSK
jgi:uncharacterized repeat protein (TIGR03803 family)